MGTLARIWLIYLNNESHASIILPRREVGVGGTKSHIQIPVACISFERTSNENIKLR